MTDRDQASIASDVSLAAAIATVARSVDPDRALASLLSAAMASVAADRGAVVLWDGERGRLMVSASIGHTPAAAAAFETAVATNSEHPVARTAHGQTAILGAETTDETGGPLLTATWPLRVTSDGVEVPLGALSVSRPAPWSFGESHATLLAAWADLIAITVDRARLSAAAQEHGEWQERMAHTDALTGLANARTLSRVLELELARAGRQGTDLSIALFDVDDLAGANTEGGPGFGDDILREVAATLAESVRLVDTVARWGGDEFLIVAPGSAGVTVAQRVLDAFAARPASKGRPITVSAGVARFPADGASSDQLVAAAEAALRTAKASGRGALAAADAR
ncbi:MAG: GGDEF domain-containing protein [Chloroflexi bacterium]|nr:GGDEF domain-containing protein [Chloroflexota bacterium]